MTGFYVVDTRANRMSSCKVPMATTCSSRVKAVHILGSFAEQRQHIFGISLNDDVHTFCPTATPPPPSPFIRAGFWELLSGAHHVGCTRSHDRSHHSHLCAFYLIELPRASGCGVQKQSRNGSIVSLRSRCHFLETCLLLAG